MTAPTPEQMRALADVWQQQLFDAAMTQSEKDKRERTVAALRAAADQLEAVQAVERVTQALFEQDKHPALTWAQMPDWVQQEYRDSARGVIAILTADTAPQEDRDACYNCHGAGYFDGGDMCDDEPCHACDGTGSDS